MLNFNILRIAASEVSVVSRYHLYTSAASVLLKYVYQDANYILENDCAVLGIELETSEESVQRILQELPSTTSCSIRALQQSLYLIKSSAQASSSLADLNTILSSPSIADLSSDQQLLLQNELRHSITTSYGSNTETLVYDLYTAYTGYDIHNRNNELLVLPMYADTRLLSATTNTFMQDPTSTTSTALKQQQVDLRNMYQCCLVDVFGILADRLPIVKAHISSISAIEPFAYYYDRTITGTTTTASIRGDILSDVMHVGLELVEEVISKTLAVSEYNETCENETRSKRSRREVSSCTTLRVCQVVLPHINNCAMLATAALVKLCEEHNLHYHVDSTRSACAVIWSSQCTTGNVPEPPLFYIIGFIDGLSTQIDMNTFCNENVVIEIKNRVSPLKAAANIYDIIQLITYCKMTACTSGDLVECYDNDIKVTRIDASSMHFHHWESSVLPKVIEFVLAVYRIRNDNVLRYQLLSYMDDAEKLDEFFNDIMSNNI